MSDTYLFEIPVYAWSPEEHYRQQDAIRRKWAAAGEAMGTDPERYGEIGVATMAGYGWQYNAVVGWLRLMADGWAIKTYVWWTTRQRIARRLPRHAPAHQYEGHTRQVSEVPTKYKSNAEIYSMLVADISAAGRRSPLKASYIDLDCFHATGPYIDWHRAMTAA